MSELEALITRAKIRRTLVFKWQGEPVTDKDGKPILIILYVWPRERKQAVHAVIRRELIWRPY